MQKNIRYSIEEAGRERVLTKKDKNRYLRIKVKRQYLQPLKGQGKKFVWREEGADQNYVGIEEQKEKRL